MVAKSAMGHGTAAELPASSQMLARSLTRSLTHFLVHSLGLCARSPAHSLTVQSKGYAKAGALSAPTLTPDQDAELRSECARILEDRLRLAVTSYAGYGLDERDGDGELPWQARGLDEALAADPFSPGHASLRSSPSVANSVRLTASSLASLRKQSGGLTGPVFE